MPAQPAPSSSPRPAAPRSVFAAWSTLKADPIGLLLPSAAALFLQTLALLALRGAARDLPWPWDGRDPWTTFVVLVAAVRLALFVVVTPLRAVLLATGARAIGRPAAPWRGLPALWLVEGASAGAQAAAWTVLAVPGSLAAGALASQGWITLGAVLLAASLVAAVVAAFAARVALAYGAYAIVLGGLGPIAALRSALADARREPLSVAAMLLVGDLATGLGGLFCGAGALAGYPIGPLALLHRWVALREVT